MLSSNRDLERGTVSNADSTRAYKAKCTVIHIEKAASGCKRTLWLIPAFVLANFAAFAAAMCFNLCLGGRSWWLDCGGCEVKSWWRISPLILDKMGASEWYKVVYQKQGWRLITSMWLHADVAHLLSNSLTLAVFGSVFEQRFGFGTTYVLSGIGGGILSLLFIQEGMSVGASGAIFGVIGAMILELITNWIPHANKGTDLLILIDNTAGAYLSILIGTAALSLGLTVFFSHMDNFGHIGGLLTGFLLGFVLLVRPQHGWANREDCSDNAHANKPKYNTYQYVLWLLSLALLITGLTVGLVLLYKGESACDHCSWCHYLTCVPTESHHCHD